MAKLSVRDVEVSSRRDHIGWNSYEIISPLVSLGCSLFADLNITDLLHRDILAGDSGGVSKKWLLAYKAVISLKRGKDTADDVLHT